MNGTHFQRWFDTVFGSLTKAETKQLKKKKAYCGIFAHFFTHSHYTLGSTVMLPHIVVGAIKFVQNATQNVRRIVL